MLSDERIQEIMAEKAGCWVAPHILAGVKAVAEAAVRDERENRNRPMALREFAELVQKLVIIGPLTSEQGRQLMMLQEMASTTLEAAVKDAVGGEPVGWQYKETRDDGTWSAWIGCCVRLEENEYRQCRPLYTRPQASAAVPEGFYAGLARVIQKLTAAQDCHPNAVQTLIAEAIEQIEAVSESALDARRKNLAASQPEVK